MKNKKETAADAEKWESSKSRGLPSNKSPPPPSPHPSCLQHQPLGRPSSTPVRPPGIYVCVCVCVCVYVCVYVCVCVCVCVVSHVASVISWVLSAPLTQTAMTSPPSGRLSAGLCVGVYLHVCVCMCVCVCVGRWDVTYKKKSSKWLDLFSSPLLQNDEKTSWFLRASYLSSSLLSSSLVSSSPCLLSPAALHPHLCFDCFIA